MASATSPSSNPKVLITGATGLLGRAVLKEFETRSYTAIGTGYTRATGNIIKLDLSDSTATRSAITSIRPRAIIHCAAEKRPDVADKNRTATENLNGKVPGDLSRLAKEIGAAFVYISSDYVFDGTSPPYNVGDKTNPLNFYGKTKLAGEHTVLENNNESAVVLRVPVLYGKAKNPQESSINGLVEIVKENRPCKMDDCQIRYPTCTDDVARVIGDIIDVNVGTKAGEQISGIFQFSAKEKLTKYEICKVFARVLGVESINNVVPVREEGRADSAAVNRPHDACLSTEALEEVGIDVGCAGFEEWWSKYLN